MGTGPAMVLAQVRTDPGFPDPHAYLAAHTPAADPSLNYMNAPAIWPSTRPDDSKCTSIQRPKRDELSFIEVCALPNPSSTQFD